MLLRPVKREHFGGEFQITTYWQHAHTSMMLHYHIYGDFFLVRGASKDCQILELYSKIFADTSLVSASDMLWMTIMNECLLSSDLRIIMGGEPG